MTQPPEVRSTPPALAWHAQHRPDATAVVEAGRSLSYAALAAEVATKARDLARRGIGPNRLVGLEVRPERTLSLVLLLALETLGATAAPLLAADLQAADPVVRHCDLLLLRAARSDADLPPSDVVEDTSPPHDREPSANDLHLLSQPVDPELIARISRTSGTTGRPKIIPTSYRVQERTVGDKFTYMPAQIRPPLVFLCIYNFGIRHIHHRVLAVLRAGGTVLLATEQAVPGLLSAGLVNHIHLMTGDAERIALTMPPSPYTGGIFVGLSGARVSPALRRLVRERLGQHTESAYSSNETNRIAMVGDDGVGTIVPGAAVRIVDDNGADVPMGQTGLIWATTQTIVDGYFDDPAATATAFVDGWYRTNDAGFVPAPGRLVVLGRADDMLNIGGLKIAPAPIEDEIRTVAGVADAALVSPGSASGTGRLVVAVEARGGGLSSQAEAEVRAVVGRHVRHFELFPLVSLPRTENGKVRRSEIEAAFRRRDG